MGELDSVSSRLRLVNERIRSAVVRAGRSNEQVRLIAVSKTKPPELIREAYAAGQRDFGENYAQELQRKADALADLTDLRWHMIGHVQRNKVRQVVKVVSAVHTLDSLRLCEEFAKRARELKLPEARRWVQDDARLNVLIEVNVAGEAQKSGCAPSEAAALADAIEATPGLRLAGLMTVPPHTDDPEAALPHFEALSRLRENLGGRQRLPELSMGMSHDFEQAIAAGASIVRVGSAIFGAREP